MANVDFCGSCGTLRIRRISPANSVCVCVCVIKGIFVACAAQVFGSLEQVQSNWRCDKKRLRDLSAARQSSSAAAHSLKISTKNVWNKRGTKGVGGSLVGVFCLVAEPETQSNKLQRRHWSCNFSLTWNCCQVSTAGNIYSSSICHIYRCYRYYLCYMEKTHTHSSLTFIAI